MEKQARLAEPLQAVHEGPHVRQQLLEHIEVAAPQAEQPGTSGSSGSASTHLAGATAEEPMVLDDSDDD